MINLKENQKFYEKCHSNSSLQKKMEQTSQKFKHFEQLALYTDPQTLSQEMIISIKTSDANFWVGNDPLNIQIIIGKNQPDGTKSIQKLLLSLINSVPRPSQRYSVIYINTLASNNAFSDFKSILEFLPFQYLYFLDKIFVLQAQLRNKPSYWINFDYIASYINSKKIHLKSIKQLADLSGLKLDRLLDLLPKDIVKNLSEKEQVVKMYTNKKTSQNIIYNSNIYNAQRDTYIKKGQTQNNCKVIPANKGKYHIEQLEIGQTGAPLIFQLLVSYFNGREYLLDSQGIFRKSVSIDDETTLISDLLQSKYDRLEQITDPHLIANAIKRFLSGLAQPIIPFADFDLLMESDENAYSSLLISIIGKLSNDRKMTLLLIFQFLVQKVLARKSSNKMNEGNLSIVFSPCLMWSKISSVKDLLFAKKSINITLILLNNLDQIFGNKAQRSLIIRKSILIQQRKSLTERLNEPTNNVSNQLNTESLSNNQMLNAVNHLIFSRLKENQEQSWEDPMLLEQLQKK